MSKMETPVLLLTGYLGSGKTTLVNHILSNKKGIKFAVIVNDIGEVNIDADLIQKGGVVGKKDESLVALQNGCICCTLKMDLIEQLNDIMKMGRFDYIVIEASGICEPEPIARTIAGIPSMGYQYTKFGTPRLDCIVTVVDALRMKDEFACGDSLKKENIDEDDIENLVIEQIEFCNIVILNKASDVEPKELERIRQIVKSLQPDAEIIESDYANVDLDKIINTQMFDYNQVNGSAGWIKIIEGRQDVETDRNPSHDDDHGHHHHDDEETVSGPSLHRSLTNNLECDDSRGNTDVEGIDVAWHRDNQMIINAFEIRLANAVFLRPHHDGDRACQISLPDGLLAFLGKRNNFQAARLKKINGIFDILNAAYIN